MIPFKVKTRVIKNRHGNMKKAVAAWRSTSFFCSDPIQLKGKIHCYGCSMRTWHELAIEFYDDKIFIVRVTNA